MTGPRTHADVVASLSASRRTVLKESFIRAGSPYPPQRLRLVGLKEEKALEVWTPVGERWRRLKSYPVLAASGGPGPKLREGDGQVPEGIYRLTAFNPNSSYHLSIRVDYPNAEDRRAAALDGRSILGSDIFIHGRAASIGCLAIGDPAIEELYLLLADTGLRNVDIVLTPSRRPVTQAGAPAWIGERYERIRQALATLGRDREPPY
jgi:L,D-transpeptidase catalytic domain